MAVLWRTWTSDDEFFFLFLNLSAVPQEINSREIWLLLTFQANWNKRGKVWKKRIHFQSDVFAAVAVVCDKARTATRTSKNNTFYKQDNNFARSSRFFVHFFARFCTTTAWKCLISRFMEDVNKQRRNFISLSVLGCGPKEFNSRRVRLHLTK